MTPKRSSKHQTRRFKNVVSASAKKVELDTLAAQPLTDMPFTPGKILAAIGKV